MCFWSGGARRGNLDPLPNSIRQPELSDRKMWLDFPFFDITAWSELCDVRLGWSKSAALVGLTRLGTSHSSHDPSVPSFLVFLDFWPEVELAIVAS